MIQSKKKIQLDLETKKSKENAIKAYYHHDFNFQDYGSILGYTDFNKREFAICTWNNFWYRNISFRQPSYLLKYLENLNPYGIYVGAIYEKSPSKDNPITKNTWSKHELVFDFDLNDYDEIRKKTCGCIGKNKFCYECWELLTSGAFFIEDTLKEDFGFKELTWTFSGRRGLHLWITDKIAMKLDKTQRNSITNYLELVKPQKIELPPKRLPDAINLTERIYSHLIQPYFSTLSNEQIKQYEQLDKNNDGDVFIKEMLRLRYPRIDLKVTSDINRVLRLPGSIHAGTGKPCFIINNINSFDPFSVKSIYEELKEYEKKYFQGGI